VGLSERVNTVYKKMMHNPKRVAQASALGIAAWFCPDFLDYFPPRQYQFFHDSFMAAVHLFSPGFAYGLTIGASKVLAAWTYDHPVYQRAKWSDYALTRKTFADFADYPVVFAQRYKKEKVATVYADPLFVEPEEYEEEGRKKKDPGILVSAALVYLIPDKIDRSLLCLRDALDLSGGSEIKLDTYSKLNLKLIELSSFVETHIHPRNLLKHLTRAMVEALLDPASGWRYSRATREIAEKFESPTLPHIAVAHAMLSSALRSSEETADWEYAIRKLKQLAAWHEQGSRTKVIRANAQDALFFHHTLLLKEHADKSQLEREIENSQRLSKYCFAVQTPRLLHLTSDLIDGNYVYAMRALSGQTLYRQFEEGNTGSLERVVHALAHVHARYPSDNLERLNIYAKLRDKLAEPLLSLSAPTVERILANYKPVIIAVTENAVWVANKDAHPENWIVAEPIGVIDCEINCLIPATFDLANLFEYTDTLSPKEIREQVFNYAKRIRYEGSLLGNDELQFSYLNRTQLLRAYYNSVIHRMICLAVAWSTPERNRQQYRVPAIQRAIRAINLLEKEDPKYYETHEQAYTDLREGLEQLKEHFT